MMACAIEKYPATLPPCTLMQDGTTFMDAAQWLQGNGLHFPSAACGGCTPTVPSGNFVVGVPSVPNHSLSPQLTATRVTPNSIRSTPLGQAPAWWESDVATKVYETLRQKETKLGNIQFDSPQICYRQDLVEYLTTVCQRLKISGGTRHLAIRLLDYFMDKHNVMEYRLKLVSLSCLLVAAKFEELDDNLPSIEVLQTAAQFGFTFGTADFYKREEFHAMELYILKFFNWNISHPTTVHFIDYYIYISMQDMPSSMTIWERSVLQNQLHDLCTHFLETALKDKRFLVRNPSEIAAASVIAARFCSQLYTIWTQKLAELTGYNLEELYPTASAILSSQDCVSC